MGDSLVEEPVERHSENISTKQTVVEDDFATIMGLTPKKGKKSRNPSTPAKKKEVCLWNIYSVPLANIKIF